MNWLVKINNKQDFYINTKYISSIFKNEDSYFVELIDREQSIEISKEAYESILKL